MNDHILKASWQALLEKYMLAGFTFEISATQQTTGDGFIATAEYLYPNYDIYNVYGKVATTGIAALESLMIELVNEEALQVVTSESSLLVEVDFYD